MGPSPGARELVRRVPCPPPVGEDLLQARDGTAEVLAGIRHGGAPNAVQGLGNLREFAMVVENALALALAEAVSTGQGAGDRRDRNLTVPPKYV